MSWRAAFQPKSYGVVLAFSAPAYVLRDLTGQERETRQAETQARREKRADRERAVYEAAHTGQTWKDIAAAHGYETPGGAYTAARRYAERYGLPPPQQRRSGRRPAE